MKKMNGFTLIELMIIVAIIGILAAVAIPAYIDMGLKKDCKEGDQQACMELSKRKIRAHNGTTVVPNQASQMSTSCIGGYLFAPNGNQIISSTNGGVPCQ